MTFKDPLRKSLPSGGVDITVESRFNKVPMDWGNWFVISRFFSIRYTMLFVIWRFVKSRFHCKWNGPGDIFRVYLSVRTYETHG